jgi:hypothetical protein
MSGYLPGSGSLSLSAINSVFDGRGLNLNAYRGTAWYTAAGGSGTFSSGAISFYDFYNKGPNPAGFSSVSLSTLPSNSFAFFTGNTFISIFLYLNSDGTWTVDDDSGTINSGNWGSPTTSGGGAAYWVKFTRTSVVPVGSPNSTPTTGWLNLSGSQYVQDNVSYYDTQTQRATYTIQIATDSGGSNIIATATLISIFAVPGTPP